VTRTGTNDIDAASASRRANLLRHRQNAFGVTRCLTHQARADNPLAACARTACRQCCSFWMSRGLPLAMNASNHGGIFANANAQLKMGFTGRLPINWVLVGQKPTFRSRLEVIGARQGWSNPFF
jgi:hypothetical protein